MEDVARDEHGHLAAQRADEVADAEDLVRVEADGRFVQDDDARFGEQRVGDPDALAEALGELPDQAAGGAAGEVAVIHDLADAFVHARGVHVLEAGAEREVFLDAKVLGQGVVLRHVRQVALGAGRIERHGDAPDRRAAGGAGHGAGKDAHGGRLAGAVRAQEADDLAGRHAEAQVFHGRQGAVALGQLFRHDGGFREGRGFVHGSSSGRMGDGSSAPCGRVTGRHSERPLLARTIEVTHARKPHEKAPAMAGASAALFRLLTWRTERPAR